MTRVGLEIAGLALVSGTALIAALATGSRSLADTLLTAYVLAMADVTACVLILSPFHAVSRLSLFASQTVLLLLVVSAWLFVGRPRWVTSLPAPQRLPLVYVLLAGGAVLALAYSIALIVGLPPNTWDSLTYHLARAAIWHQHGGVAYIAHAYDERLNGNPPGAEIGFLYVLETTGSERLTAALQLAAALACSLAAYSLARRLGLSRGEASFGGLLLLTLPIVLIQSSTAQNDLVVAALLAAATVWLLDATPRALTLAAVATALAVGTKITALYALPILAATGLAASGGRARWRLTALASGILVGGYWYLINLAHTGHLFGNLADRTGASTLFEFRRNIVTALSLAKDTFDLSGATGRDLYLYVFVALVLVTALTIAARRKPSRITAWEVVIAGVLALSCPLLVVVGSHVWWRGSAKMIHLLGYAPPAAASSGANRVASDSYSWFGPLGLALGLAVLVGRRRIVAAQTERRLALVFAGAPLAWLVLLALSISYDPFRGRFFVYPVVLSASLWGAAARWRASAWALVAVALTTMLLVMVHIYERPSGRRLLEPATQHSVWGRPRWDVQSFARAEMRPVLRFIQAEVPATDSIALAIGADDWGYPAFGPHLTRRVLLVPFGSRARAIRAQWLLANPARAASIDTTCWQRVFNSGGWEVLRRRSTTCSS